MNIGFPGLNAVYRLTGAGEWLQLSERPADAHEETRLEMLATLCIDHISQGEEVMVEYGGARCVIAQRDAEGVRVGFVENAGAVNPMLMRTALKRAETRSVRGAAVSQVASQVSERVREDDLLEAAASPHSLDDHGSSERSAPSEPVTEDTLRHNQSGDFDGIEFDIVFDDSDSSEVEVVDAAAGAPPASTPTRPRPSWDAAGEFIAEGLEASSNVLGKTIACNYWRQALRNADLELEVDVDFRGRVKAPQGGQHMPSEKMTAFSRAHARWLERCRSIDPSFDFPIERLYDAVSATS